LPLGGRALRIYTDLPWVVDEVTAPRFQVVSDSAAADVVFLAKGGFVTGAEQLVSFFNYEAAFVRKDHLSRLLRCAGLGAETAPETFDLDVDLDAALHAMTLAGPGAFWILKPNSLGRSIGHAVTDSRACAVAHALAGGYVAQRYIEHPHVLPGLEKRKYDVRVVALLRSSEPLEAYVHDTVFIRAANKAHVVSPRALEDVEVSLTAMHLVGAEARHPSTKLFAEAFDNENGAGAWSNSLKSMRKTCAAVFRAAATQHAGFAETRGARAMYGFDFMLSRDLQPKLLEVTFSPSYLANSPDMADVYDEFAHECMGCLFLGEQAQVTRLE